MLWFAVLIGKATEPMADQKSVLITGASSGIGLATTQALVKKQYRVFAGARKPADLERLKKEVGAEPVELDVARQDHISSLEGFLSSRLGEGSLYAVINNAGISRHGPVECVPMEAWREQFETNIFGAVAVTQVVLPWIRKSRGRVINVSSISGRVAAPLLAPYAASKFALDAISDSLRRELYDLGVKVSSINPGFIRTPMLEKIIDKAELERQFFKKEGQREAYLPLLQKMGDHVEDAKKKANSVDVVVKAIVHALESRSPKTRYYVGKGMTLAASLFSHLPDSWIDKIILKHIE
jgi:NAD(P)-dependent dehydrogenase (short-subunit alcohol dehydrogenase family)